jgi:Fic family protein
MEAALALADSLDEDSILRMHRELLSRQPGWERHAGSYRDQLVWVGRSAVTPRGASHVAPQHELVRPAMADLVAFMRRDDLPVVAQAAIAHAQFETIHPFSDGNGRTGRALVHAMLKGKGLLRSTTAPVSAGLLRTTDTYFAALDAYRQGDARPIVEQFCAASRYAANSGSRLIDSLARQLRESEDALDRARVRSDAWARRILPHLVANPAVTSAFLKERFGLSDPTVHRALNALTAAEVLVERTGKQRGRVWQHPGIIAELDAYAQAIRRS